MSKDEKCIFRGPLNITMFPFYVTKGFFGLALKGLRILIRGNAPD
jgi:hypothetical protein